MENGLKVDYAKFLADAEKTIKDSLALVDTIVGDGVLRNEAYAVMRDIGMMFMGLSVAGMLAVVADLDALIAAMKADAPLQAEALLVVQDLEVLKADMVM